MGVKIRSPKEVQHRLAGRRNQLFPFRCSQSPSMQKYGLHGVGSHRYGCSKFSLQVTHGQFKEIHFASISGLARSQDVKAQCRLAATFAHECLAGRVKVLKHSLVGNKQQVPDPWRCAVGNPRFNTLAGCPPKPRSIARPSEAFEHQHLQCTPSVHTFSAQPAPPCLRSSLLTVNTCASLQGPTGHHD